MTHICPRCSLQWPVSPLLFLPCSDRTAVSRAGGGEPDLTRGLHKHQSSSEDVNPRLRARARKTEETRSVAAFSKPRNRNGSRQRVLIIALPVCTRCFCVHFGLGINGVLWRLSACSNDVRAQTGWAGACVSHAGSISNWTHAFGEIARRALMFIMPY